MKVKVTLNLRFRRLEETLLLKFGDYVLLHVQWHSDATCTVWLIDSEGTSVQCRFNRGLSGQWTLIPVSGIDVGGSAPERKEISHG